ncbi:SCO4225 family membrane protein [Nonomuraea sp. 10N515B]|uniref:SCO4225 family membrane protein n=1 Tax=Nonomuraea sp. 10N515B TaxID=3457422 RepID=UPI003FCCCCDD
MSWIGTRVRRRRNGRRAALAAGSYLAVVVVTAGVAEYVSVTSGAPIGASVVLMVITLPTSLLAILPRLFGIGENVLEGDGLLIALVGCGVFQAWLLWLLLRGPRIR